MPAPAPPPPRLGWRYAPHAIVFLSSACVMIVELVAGRLIGRHLGNSLYTWTSVIAVVLAGISGGNYVGGRMADRWRPESFLGFLFLGASMACLLTLALNQLVPDTKILKEFYWPARVFWTVLIIFLLPALGLGMISPATAKMALDRSRAVGATLGSVYAWGAVGSIVGTLLTGFWLISALGAKGVVVVVAACLGLVGLALGPHRWLHAIWVLLLGVAFYLSRSADPDDRAKAARMGLCDAAGSDLFSGDSDYQYVRVYEGVSDEDFTRPVRVLSLDYLIHGYVDPDDPGHLEYDYELLYREIARRVVGERPRLSAFFIGGGSYTFPRWVLHEWPGSAVDVAEIDPMVIEANHAALGLPRDTPIRTFPVDARIAVDNLPPDRKYDLVFGDAFNDLSVPWHLTTLEFARKVKDRLAAGGAYLVNVIDAFESGLMVGSYYSTLRLAFNHVYVFCTEKEGVGPDRDTFVLVGTDTMLDVGDLLPGHGKVLPGSLLTEGNLQELVEKSGRRVLTDDNAPVENLLQPVLRKRK